MAAYGNSHKIPSFFASVPIPFSGRDDGRKCIKKDLEWYEPKAHTHMQEFFLHLLFEIGSKK